MNRFFVYVLIVFCLARCIPLHADESKLDNAHRAYLESEFENATKLSEGQLGAEFKLITCLSLYERHELYGIKEDRKRASILRDILEIDLGMQDIPTLKRYFNISGHDEGNDQAADLLKDILKRYGTADDCRVVASLLREDIGEQAAYNAYRALEHHLENVRDYVNDGGTMPKIERDLFQDAKFILVLIHGLKNEKTDSTAEDCLIAIEEPAISILEQAGDNREIYKVLLKVKKAREKRKKEYPDSTWYSAFGLRSVPAPTP